jgi:hypothetical protein
VTELQLCTRHLSPSRFSGHSTDQVCCLRCFRRRNFTTCYGYPRLFSHSRIGMGKFLRFIRSLVHLVWSPISNRSQCVFPTKRERSHTHVWIVASATIQCFYAWRLFVLSKSYVLAITIAAVRQSQICFVHVPTTSGPDRISPRRRSNGRRPPNIHIAKRARNADGHFQNNCSMCSHHVRKLYSYSFAGVAWGNGLVRHHNLRRHVLFCKFVLHLKCSLWLCQKLSKSRTGFRTTDSVLNMLIRITIETGMVTGMYTISFSCLYHLWPTI